MLDPDRLLPNTSLSSGRVLGKVTELVRALLRTLGSHELEARLDVQYMSVASAIATRVSQTSVLLQLSHITPGLDGSLLPRMLDINILGKDLEAVQRRANNTHLSIRQDTSPHT